MFHNDIQCVDGLNWNVLINSNQSISKPSQKLTILQFARLMRFSYFDLTHSTFFYKKPIYKKPLLKCFQS